MVNLSSHSIVVGHKENFVEKHFKVIVESIKSEPSKTFQATISEREAHVQVSYRPNDRYSSASYSSYNVPYSLRRNPIYNRLRDKSRQLKKSGFEGIAGVFLCDGDCNALRSTMYGPEFTKQRIISEAFRQNSTLSFVVTLTIDEKNYPLGIKSQRAIKTDFYTNPQAKIIVGREFCRRLNKMCNFFPLPQATPGNALCHMTHDKHKGYSFMGGGSMAKDKITIPSRTLTEILAGTLNYYAANEREQGPLGSIAWMKDFFRRQVSDGKTIDEISVVNCPDEDDDWIRIKYGSSDPAISKFK